MFRSAPSPHTITRVIQALIGMLVLVPLVLVSCGTSSGSVSNTPTVGITSTPSVSPTSTPGTTGYPVKVFFSKYPETSITAVYPVDRVSPTNDMAFPIQLLIAGPTSAEHAAGYFSELNTSLTGPSNCASPLPLGGPDFTLKLNMKGATPEQGTATVQLCRATLLAGDATGPRITAEITATLKQFSAITKVVILDAKGNCFADLRGGNTCLQ
jgi:hypothetical protein